MVTYELRSSAVEIGSFGDKDLRIMAKIHASLLFRVLYLEIFCRYMHDFNSLLSY